MVVLNLKSEYVQLPSYFKGIAETQKQLDPTNIKILTAMWKHGPRNLLEISRRTGIPFTSVYHRVAKLEGKSGRVAYVMPETSRLGLVRVVVLAAANPGCGDMVTWALKLPNVWRFINHCEGSYTNISAHAVPPRYLKPFNRYVRRLAEKGMISRFKIIYTGDSMPNFPNFQYYNPTVKRWSFEWTRWLLDLKKNRNGRTLEDPPNYKIHVDKKDLLIIKELEKNARRTLADLAPMLKMSVAAVKYRYDKLTNVGGVQQYAFDVHAFPVEISAYHEIMLEFTSSQKMNRFYACLRELPFILSVAKVLQRNAMLVRTYVPETQLANMFAFFSELTNAGFLASYSSLRLNFAGRETQTISYELYNDESGWLLNLKKCTSELAHLSKKRLLATAKEKQWALLS